MAALAWTMQIVGPTPTRTEPLTSEREVVATDRFPTVEEVSRRAEQPLRRPTRQATPRRHTPATTTPAPRPCVRTAELQTLLCVWRT